jgi:hypothetical protein
MWRIDLSQVSSEIKQKKQKQLQEACHRIQHSDPLQITSICVHEAAHEIYGHLAGIISFERQAFIMGYSPERELVAKSAAACGQH